MTIFQLVYVADENGLSLAFSETLKTGFVVSRPKLIIRALMNCITFIWNNHECMSVYVGLVMTIPVFGVTNKVGLKPPPLQRRARTIGIWLIASLDMILSKMQWSVCVGAQAGLRLSYSQTTKTRFQASRYWLLILIKNSKWVWSGNTTITNCRQLRGTARKSRSTITRHQKDKSSKATSSLLQY